MSVAASESLIEDLGSAVLARHSIESFDLQAQEIEILKTCLDEQRRDTMASLEQRDKRIRELRRRCILLEMLCARHGICTEVTDA